MDNIQHGVKELRVQSSLWVCDIRTIWYVHMLMQNFIGREENGMGSIFIQETSGPIFTTACIVGPFRSQHYIVGVCIKKG